MPGIYKRVNGVWVQLGLGPIPDTTPPGAPSNLRVTAKTNTSLTVAWNAATDDRGVAGYQMQVNNGTWQPLGNVLTATVTGLTAATSYTIRVRAFDAAGNTTTSPAQVTDTTAGTPTPTNSIIFGACPGTTGGVAGIDAKYGTKSETVRIFQSVLSTNGLPNDRPCHVSAKYSGPASILSGANDAAITAWCRAQTQPRLPTFWHEPENDLNQFSLTDYRAAQERFAQLILNSGASVPLEPTVVLMAWTFDSRSGRNPDDWITPSIKVLGVDFDGDDNPTSTTYPMFAPARAALPAFLTKWGLTLSIAEFAAPLATGDSSGAGRSAWLTQFAGTIFPGLGARHVHLFDYPGIYGAREPLQTPAEIATWAGYLANSPTPPPY